MDKTSSAGHKLSVAMICRDAEATIAAALDSVRAIADEIVVVDTGSTDRTRELARPRASKFLEHSWSDDFSAARNFALQHVTGDWVLWMDASEQLDAESAAAIRQQLDSQSDPQRAYLLLIQMPPGAGQLDGEQVGRIRLWPTKAALKFEGRVREQLTPTIEMAGLSQQTTTWRIRRSARDVDPHIKAVKAHRDLALADLETTQRGERPQLHLACGEACAALGEPLKAAGWFRRAIDDAPPASTEQLEAYYGLLTTFDSRPQARDEQIATCIKALEVFPLDAQLLCAMGSYLQNQGRLDLASRSYQMAVEHGQVNLRTWHLANLAEMATVCYVLTLELQGRREEARQTLEMALVQCPSVRLRRHLIELHIKHNRRQEALAEADRLACDKPQRDAFRNAVRGGCLAAQQQWPAALAYLRTAYDAGCRDPIGLRWLAAALIASGDAAAAEPVLGEWQAIAPDSPEPMRWRASLAAQNETPTLAVKPDENGARSCRADHPAAAAVTAPKARPGDRVPGPLGDPLAH